jgi:hypothetical protein
VHTVVINAAMTGDQWAFVPLLDQDDLFSNGTATIRRPSRLDLGVRPWGKWVTATFLTVLMGAWLASAIKRIHDLPVVTWAIVASLGVGLLVGSEHPDLARWSIVALACAILLPVPARLRNVFGAFMLVGVPWLTFIGVRSAPLIGRFTLYEWGNDFWTFQRFAYRIVMQGYWLEGGSPTFWFQPLYRWIAGVLHLIFGDSSVGESYWDGACVLAGALVAFRVTKVFAGFRWALVAAVTALGVFVLGTAGGLVGRGLGEITSAGFIYLAIFFALRSRHRNWRPAAVAGLLATLGFYTRLNNLVMALGVCAFALSPRLAARDMFGPTLRVHTSWRTLVIIGGTFTIGLLLFAWRTWHYTGVFSIFYGTQRDLLAIWQSGLPARAVLDRMASSVMMVLTVNDPPRWDPFALPVVLGGAVTVLALARVPRVRDIPLAPALFFWTAIAGAFVARGSAYAGRFSVHAIPITSALFVCALAAFFKRRQASG